MLLPALGGSWLFLELLMSKWKLAGFKGLSQPQLYIQFFDVTSRADFDLPQLSFIS